MAKTLSTRIKNRFDSLNAWQADGVELLAGEIALVSVTTQHKDDNGNIIDVPAVLMKVGETGKTFKQLPWLSAKAADVYDWAKVQYAANIPVTFNENGTTKETLNDYLVKVNSTSAEVAAIKEIFDIVDEGAGSFVTDITYDSTTGTFTISRSYVDTEDILDGAVIEAKLATDAVTTEKIKNGNVTDAKIDTVSASKVIYTAGDDAASTITLPEKISEVESEIAAINTAIAGGVHFVGITTTAITDGSTTGTIKINDKDYSANNGDVVIYKANAATAEDEEKEFIWVQPEGSTSGHWEVLGDLSRVATLETWRTGLTQTAVTDAAPTNNKFVTAVTQSDGKITVNSYVPSSADVTHTEGTATTVKATLEAHAAAIGGLSTGIDALNGADTVSGSVAYKIKAAINGLDVPDPTASGTSTSFIATASQADGKIVVTKKNLPDASTAAKGIVQLSSATNSDSETLAATPKAVKAAYEQGAGAGSGVADIKANYVRVNDNDQLVSVKGDIVEIIIFDCGGASTDI